VHVNDNPGNVNGMLVSLVYIEDITIAVIASYQELSRVDLVDYFDCILPRKTECLRKSR
jgi:hypothetical protein